MEIFIHLLVHALQATRSGTVYKKVACEKCGFRFGYQMSRTVTITAFATREQQAHLAEVEVQHVLAQDCDPHPCPGCGWYQQNMVRRLRWEATNQLPMWTVALVLVSGGFFALAAMVAFDPVAWAMKIPQVLIGGGCTVLAVVLMFCLYRVYRRLAGRFNSNHAFDELNVSRFG